jgi:hypothetical protein
MKVLMRNDNESSRWEKTWLEVGKGNCKQTSMKKKAKFSNKIAKLVEFTLEKKSKVPKLLGRKNDKFVEKKNININ